MTIANLRRLDGAYKPSKPEGGIPALDFFAPEDKPMCVPFELILFFLSSFDLMFWTQVLYSRQGRKQDSIVRILVLPHALLRNGDEEARRLAGTIAGGDG